MIPDEIVQRVRDAADIVEVIGEHVKLKRVGNDYRGPCPFHGGKNPNFSVSPRKGIYHCYKCGVSGDVFGFLREHLGMEFVDTVRTLGARFGVEVREVSNRRPGERDEREPLWEVLGAAAALFQESLWQDPAAAPAREYLESRSIPRELADEFGIGFAPRDGVSVRDRLAALGYSPARQLEVGLLVQREGEQEARPRFRGRLMFPIADLGGHVVGFGGRVIGPGEPKYLNSPETPVFNKGHLLYNLHRAKQSIRKDDRALVVEGYFDVLRLAGAGIEGAVAPLGTALTEAQAALLTRYSKHVFLLYDSDEAGLKATFRAGKELLRHGVAVRVVTLPEGEDPDTFVAKHGAERLERHLSAAMDVFDRQIQLAERGGWFADLSRKRKAVDRLIPTIRAVSDPVTRDIYLTRLGEVAGVDRAVLQREVEQPEQLGSRGGTPVRGTPAVGGAPGPSAGPPPAARPAWQPGNRPPRPWNASGGGRGGRGGPGRGRGRWGDRREAAELMDSSPPRPTGSPTRGAERSLVLAMLHLDGYIESIAQEVGPESFRDPLLAEIFSVLSARGEVGDLDALAGELTPEAVQVVDALMGAAGELMAPKRIVADSLAQLHYFDLRDRIELLELEMRDATGEKRAALEEERGRLRAELKALGPRGNWARRLGT